MGDRRGCVCEREREGEREKGSAYKTVATQNSSLYTEVFVLFIQCVCVREREWTYQRGKVERRGR